MNGTDDLVQTIAELQKAGTSRKAASQRLFEVTSRLARAIREQLPPLDPERDALYDVFVEEHNCEPVTVCQPGPGAVCYSVEDLPDGHGRIQSVLVRGEAVLEEIDVSGGFSGVLTHPGGDDEPYHLASDGERIAFAREVAVVSSEYLALLRDDASECDGAASGLGYSLGRLTGSLRPRGS